jgi:hypothetical protein
LLDLAVTGAGKLKLWLGTPIGWGASHTVTVPGDASGRPRAAAGDFTGDGRDDLLVAQGRGSCWCEGALTAWSHRRRPATSSPSVHRRAAS